MNTRIKKPPAAPKLIAVIGGSFDPIHHGHLTAAQAVFEHLQPDYCLFMPTGQPPHKQTKTYAWHRYFMTVLAAADNPHFFVSPLEIERGGLSFTIDTLRELRHNLNCEPVFVVGADEILQIERWKDFARLLREFRFIACTRPGYELGSLPQNVELLTIPALDISGTAIREQVKAGRSARYLVPASAAAYIDAFGLYKNSAPNNNNIEAIQQNVAEKLSARRYKHTIGVIETALLLAHRYEADMHKAYLAALLHDYCKEETEADKRRLCEEFNLELDPIQAKYINLTHGMLGAEMTRRKFGITDPEILQAIRCHTTGSSDMTMLDKIIKLSDAIEPYRREDTTLKPIRERAFLCINAALRMSMEKDRAYNISMGRTLHPMSESALNNLKFF